MKFKRYTTALLAVLLMIGIGACDSGLTELNENPNEPENVPPGNLLANAIMDGVGGAYGSHGVWYGLYLTNLWSQHLAQPEYNDEDSYVPRPAQLNSIWDAAYTGPLADLDAVKDIAQEEGNDQLFAVAEILTQWQFQKLTDVYGDIPYSEALAVEEGITSPSYDPQAQVYAGILQNLAAASDMINPAAAVQFGAGDILYGGDMEKWQRFANSLRMRAAMRIADVDEAQARAAFVDAYNDGAFQSVEDNAVLQWGTQRPSQNPINEHFQSRPLTDFAVSQAIVDTLTSLDDPRLEIYADPALSDGEYRGLPNGTLPEELERVTNDFSFIGERFRAADAPSVLVSYAEVLFHQAEAVERGWITGNAEALWREGIEASMQQHGIAQAEIDTYLAGVTYEGMESIWLQEWIALYLNGGEAWALVRRTGYPQLTPAAGDQIPLRINYPPDEDLYNPDHYREVTLFDRLWWDVD